MVVHALVRGIVSAIASSFREPRSNKAVTPAQVEALMASTEGRRVRQQERPEQKQRVVFVTVRSGPLRKTLTRRRQLIDAVVGAAARSALPRKAGQHDGPESVDQTLRASSSCCSSPEKHYRSRPSRIRHPVARPGSPLLTCSFLKAESRVGREYHSSAQEPKARTSTQGGSTETSEVSSAWTGDAPLLVGQSVNPA